MRIADTVQDSIVDGPGFRFTVFTQGCFHNCPGCHNPGTHDVNGGREMSPADVIAEMLRNPLTDGVTFSGGEPFLQPEGCAEIARAARAEKLNVWAYTGYTFEKLMELAKDNASIREFMELIDVLIDGPFIIEEKSFNVKWRGSSNQRVLDMAASLKSGTAVIKE